MDCVFEKVLLEFEHLEVAGVLVARSLSMIIIPNVRRRLMRHSHSHSHSHPLLTSLLISLSWMVFMDTSFLSPLSSEVCLRKLFTFGMLGTYSIKY